MLRVIFICMAFLLVLAALKCWAGQGFEYVPDAHTLALYHLNEGKGDKVIDASPNKFDGKVEGKAEWNGEEWKKKGSPGHSFVFDGNTVINLGNVKELIKLDAITVEAWVFPEDLNGWRLICCNWAGPPGAYHLACQNGMPRFHVHTDKGTADASGGKLEIGKWYHIAGSYDSRSGEIKLYIDGKLAASGKLGGKLADNDYDIVIGSKHTREFKWVGRIDEVRISDVAREPEELSPNLTKPPSPVSLLENLFTLWGLVKKLTPSSPGR